jgi:hypothetical protein
MALFVAADSLSIAHELVKEGHWGPWERAMDNWPYATSAWGLRVALGAAWVYLCPGKGFCRKGGFLLFLQDEPAFGEPGDTLQVRTAGNDLWDPVCEAQDIQDAVAKLRSWCEGRGMRLEIVLEGWAVSAEERSGEKYNTLLALAKTVRAEKPSWGGYDNPERTLEDHLKPEGVVSYLADLVRERAASGSV